MCMNRILWEKKMNFLVLFGSITCFYKFVEAHLTSLINTYSMPSLCMIYLKVSLSINGAQ